MREHLFRGKRFECIWPDDKPWVEGSLIDSGNHEQVLIFPPLDRASSFGVKDLVRIYAVPVDAETVGEWTGFLDHHGTKIYEGDFVLFDTGKGITLHRVVWDSDAWRTLSISQPLMCPNNLDAFFATRCRVCGNIHDNPELSEGSV